MRKIDVNLAVFVAILILYLLGQFIIGTYSPSSGKFTLSAPADIDFLYYGAIANGLLNDFPPPNPAFCGERLTQPFLQYYPLALLTKLLDPFIGIRILNIGYIILLGLLLRCYFPSNYARPLLLLAAASTFMADLNSLGVDLIARGFTHAPFFILLTVALYGRSIIFRSQAIFLASLLNGYLMLIIVPFLALLALWKRTRAHLLILIAAVAGLAAAAWFISSLAEGRPLLQVLTTSFRLDPSEIIIHAAPIIILAVIYRNREMILLLSLAVLFGSLVHYNPFFPIFLVYYAGAMTVAVERPRIKAGETLASLVLATLFVGFLSSSYQKYDPHRGGFHPRFDARLEPAFDWIETKTSPDDCFFALTADGADMALVMALRPVYLGYISHLSHLGIRWQERYNATLRFGETGEAPEEVRYIFYGPVEQRYFPNVSPRYPVVYRDSVVTIYSRY